MKFSNSTRNLKGNLISYVQADMESVYDMMHNHGGELVRDGLGYFKRTTEYQSTAEAFRNHLKLGSELQSEAYIRVLIALNALESNRVPRSIIDTVRYLPYIYETANNERNTHMSLTILKMIDHPEALAKLIIDRFASAHPILLKACQIETWIDLWNIIGKFSRFELVLIRDVLEKYMIPVNDIGIMMIKNYDAFNGYISVPKNHPWHGHHYDSIDCEIHGGLTFSGRLSDFSPNMEAVQITKYQPTEEDWIIGFDTHHAGDTTETQDVNYVFRQCTWLRMQAIEFQVNVEESLSKPISNRDQNGK